MWYHWSSCSYVTWSMWEIVGSVWDGNFGGEGYGVLGMFEILKNWKNTMIYDHITIQSHFIHSLLN